MCKFEILFIYQKIHLGIKSKIFILVQITVNRKGSKHVSKFHQKKIFIFLIINIPINPRNQNADL